MAFIGNQIITINSLLDLDGQELVLDADADSTIHVSTDDQIDFKIGGTDVATFTNSSSDFVITQAVQDKDIIFKGDDNGSPITALTLDMSEAGNASFNGTVTANAGLVVDNITIDGTEIDLSSGDLTLDSAGDIILSAAGGEIRFDDGSQQEFVVDMNDASTKTVLRTLISDSDLVFEGNDGGTGFEAMRIDMSEGGRVGIGTTSPATALDVDGGANSDQATFSGTASRGLKISTFSVGAADEGVDFDAQASGSTQALTFSTGGTERVRVDGSGNVGIGATPSTKFHVKVATNQNFNVFAPGVGTTGVTLGATTDGFGAFAEMEQRATQFVFHNGTTERMRIDSSGTVRIANTSGNLFDSSSATGVVAGTSLQVATDGSTVGFFNRLSSIGQILGFYNDGTQVGQINVGTLSNAGRILIGNSNCNLLFNDGVPEIVPASSNGVKRDGDIDFGNATGRFQDIRATNGTIQTSDKNEKNTIVDSDLGIDFINRLSPKSYKFNNKTRTHYGLIAQDIETVLGDIKKDATQFAGFCKDDISEKQDGSEYRYGLRYTQFISPMIQAIKDLKAEVDTLKEKVTALESK
jgi:hypothetical protein